MLLCRPRPLLCRPRPLLVCNIRLPCRPDPRWEASQKAIRNVDFSAAHADGVLISCDEAGACRLWAADNGELIAELQAPPGVLAGSGTVAWCTRVL